MVPYRFLSLCERQGYLKTTTGSNHLATALHLAACALAIAMVAALARQDEKPAGDGPGLSRLGPLHKVDS